LDHQLDSKVEGDALLDVAFEMEPPPSLVTLAHAAVLMRKALPPSTGERPCSLAVGVQLRARRLDDPWCCSSAEDP
jgi:hypothetical protein